MVHLSPVSLFALLVWICSVFLVLNARRKKKDSGHINLRYTSFKTTICVETRYNDHEVDLTAKLQNHC